MTLTPVTVLLTFVTSSVFSLIFIMLILPLHFFRFLIGGFARIRRPDLIRLVSLRSSVWTSDPLHTSPETNITILMTFAGIIDRDLFVKDFEVKVLPKYPRLRQYFVTWLGYPFWTKDSNFNINHHLQIYPQPLIGQSQLCQLANEINRRPWSIGHSPWCGISIENYRVSPESPLVSAFIFNIHHSLSDAYGAQCLLFSLVGKTPPKPTNDITRELPFDEQGGETGDTFKAIVTLSSDLLNLRDSNDLRRLGQPVLKDRDIDYCIRNDSGKLEISLPYSEIHNIQERFNVTKMAVMGTLSGGCVQRVCGQLKLNYPDKINLMTPYSHPGHIGDITNYQSFVFLQVPIRAAGSLKERLYKVESEVQRLRCSGLSKLFAKLIPLCLGVLPIGILKHAYKVELPSGMMIAVGIDEILEFHEIGVTDISFISGPLPGNQGIFFFFMKYGQKFKIGMALSKSYEKMLNIQSLIQNMADDLKKLATMKP